MKTPALALILGSTLLASACSKSSGATSGTTATTTGGTTTGPTVLAPGQPCTSNAACGSRICGLNGTGNCCVGPARCVIGDPTCGATGCDDTGYCAYPSPSTTCGASSCQGTTLTPEGVCNGQGICHAATPDSCPNNFACADGGVCATGCTKSAECQTDFICNAGACVAKISVGPCTEDDDCGSGHCGPNGTGNCCAAACADAGAPCGATDCDATTGACDYPAATVACGSVLASCSNGEQQNPSLCDGVGGCDSSPGKVSCGGFACGTDVCLTTCSDNTACGGGGFCDVANTTCCQAISDGGNPAVITVDSVQGTDAACCGYGSAAPCATISRAMKLVDGWQFGNTIITATVDGGGGDWAPKGETYPIVLGWGVVLEAPGVYFNDTSRQLEIFDIAKYSASDFTGSATIVGTPANPVVIGIDKKFENQTGDSSAIKVESLSTLHLAAATVNGNPDDLSNAITVIGGALLELGTDPSGTLTGTVIIGGNDLPDGYNGIVCTAVGALGCTISDSPQDGGASAVVIQNQEGLDIDAEDNASITLVSNPAIGLPPLSAGFQECPSKDDAEFNSPSEAVLLNGSASMTFKNGTVSCIAGDGFLLQASASGGKPSLTIDNSTIEETDLGIYASAGTATITSTAIQYNYNGVEQDSTKTTTGTISLGGGGNSVVCDSSIESSQGGGGQPAVAVLNTTSQTLDATKTAWDTAGPDRFLCNSAFSTCTCESGSCAVDAGTDGMDAVYESTGDGGTITTTGNTLSAADCTVPVNQGCGIKGGQCPPGDICCIPFDICVPIMEGCP